MIESKGKLATMTASHVRCQELCSKRGCRRGCCDCLRNSRNVSYFSFVSLGVGYVGGESKPREECGSHKGMPKAVSEKEMQMHERDD